MHYFFTSFLPYKLPSQTLMFVWWVCIAQIMLPLQITNVSSYFIISHSVKAKNLFWEVEWVVFHSVSNNIKVKKKKKCCTVLSPPPTRISFLVTLGFSSGLWRIEQSRPLTIVRVIIFPFAVLLYLKSSYCTAQTMDCTYFYILCLILLFLNKKLNIENKSVQDLWASCLLA